jgi:hypothetical protein
LWSATEFIRVKAISIGISFKLLIEGRIKLGNKRLSKYVPSLSSIF